jgi:peptidoglycan/xylan/chitin deacetylase (PgdA/CDA1 family)
MKLKILRSAPLALAYWLGIAGAAQRDDGRARILMLHGVPRRQRALLERMLRYLKRHFDIVPLEELAGAVARRERLSRRVAITFDDGLRNNVEVAYPILRALGVHATFFLCPQLIEERAWLWNQEMRQRLRRLPSLHELSMQTGGPREVEAFVEWMKNLDLPRRREVEARVRAATPNFTTTQAERHQFELAGWDELRRLDPRVVAIGSHTLTHPILPSLSAADLEREVSHSRRLLEQRLQRKVTLFAYPNGDASPAVYECVKKNYSAAVTTEEGYVAAGCDAHLLPRVNLPGDVLRLALALHRRVAPSNASGSQVASSGKTAISAMHSTIMKKNGSDASAT